MRDTNPDATDGQPAHVPVLLDEVVDALGPADGETYVDGTFGAGGYADAVLQAADCRVIAIDRDPSALVLGSALAQRYPGRLELVEGRFGQMFELAGQLDVGEVDGVMLDLGVSSMQLDQPQRGFSFAHDGPLDMRMDRDAGDATAADLVNGCDEGVLANILYRFGEERHSRRIARAIVAARRTAPIETTRQLAAIVERAMPGRGAGKIHPATRTFQALRIQVNGELEEIGLGLCAAERLLKAGGRLVVVSFHSLEDRIVKAFFRTRSGPGARPSRHMPEAPDSGPEPSFRMIHRGAVGPGSEETARNPRARSAKLRAATRTEAPALPCDLGALSVPRVEGV